MAKLQSLSTAGKETIYVDVDDEITAVIDKVQAAKGKIVALVLPKRAPVLQSIVNMKLLKRTVETAGKNLVLITSEAGLLPLAGSVGLFVAGTPTSKPAIPAVPAGPDETEEIIDEPLSIVDGTDDGDEFDPRASADKPVGELAGGGTAADKDDADDTIDMADDDSDDKPAAATAPQPVKKNKKLKVPNFDRFRKKVALGILAVMVLIGAWVLAFVVLPKATITIHTDSNTIPTNLNLVLSTTATKLDADNKVVPATAQTQQKTSTQQVPATGQQNNGQKAGGSVTLTNCGKDGSSITVPAGTTLSSGGYTFVLQESANLPTSSFSGGGTCQSFNGYTSKTVDVVALKGGAAYNIDPATFTVSGYGAVQAKSSSAMTGGTDNIVKIVTQSDIDGATAKITSTDSDSVKQQLTSGLQSKGLMPVPATFVAGTPQVTSTANAGDQADTVTVTATTTYTMLGVQQSDLKTLVENNVTGQLDKGKQVILDDGVANAAFTAQGEATPTGATISMSVKSQVGPHIDIDQLKKQLAGKKSGDVKALIKQTPGVSGVDVKFGPFWVNTVPKNSGKVTINTVKAR